MSKAVYLVLISMAVLATSPANATAGGKKRPAPAAIDISTVADNADVGCIDTDVANKLVRDYNIDIRGFSGGRELCDSAKPGKQILNAVLMLDQGKFGPTARAGLDRQMVSTDYSRYLRQRINHITFDNSCGGTSWVLACIINRAPTMHIEKPYFDKDMALALQMTVLVHEARHTEGYMHYHCYTGGNAGKDGACDNNYADGGSYAVEVEYETRIALNGLNFHPVFKMMARLFAIDRLNNNFVSQPTTKAPSLILVDQADSHITVVNADAQIKDYPNVIIGKSRLIGRDAGANVIADDLTQKPKYLDYYDVKLFAQEAVAPIVGLTMRNYAGTWPEAKRQSLVDIMNDASGGGVQVRLFKDSLEAAKGIENAPTVALPAAETPKALLGILPCDTSKATPGFYVRMASGAIYEIETSRLPRQTSLTAVSCTWPQDLVALTRLGDRVVALDTDGRLSTVDESGKRSPLVSGPEFAGRRFSQMVSSGLVPELVAPAAPSYTGL